MRKKWIWVFTMVWLCCSGCGQENAAEGENIPIAQTAEEQKAECIQAWMSQMDTEEKIGQMLMIDFRQNTDGSDMTVLSEAAAETIRTNHLGGVILFAENLDTTEQTQQLILDMQAAAEFPLAIGMDEEGGMVSRLDKSRIPHMSIPNAAELAGDPARAKVAGAEIGAVLAELGINVDFAPVADINTNQENPVIGERAYGTDAQTVAVMAEAFRTGLEENRVSAVAKHFPGHGDTATDSHDGMAVLDHDLQRLREVEFVPFQTLIDAGIDWVMVGHITMPKVTGDNLPASLSKEAIDLLRQELGFSGIIVTDAMNMGAITQYDTDGMAAVMAIQAGADVVLMPSDLQQTMSALQQAVMEGEITQQRLEESVYRILSWKYDCGMLEEPAAEY